MLAAVSNLFFLRKALLRQYLGEIKWGREPWLKRVQTLMKERKAFFKMLIWLRWVEDIEKTKQPLLFIFFDGSKNAKITKWFNQNMFKYNRNTDVLEEIRRSRRSVSQGYSLFVWSWLNWTFVCTLCSSEGIIKRRKQVGLHHRCLDESVSGRH